MGIGFKHTPPRQIILYSWIMPCKDCTQKIIQTFRQSPFNSTSVIIAYTIEYYKETDRQAIVNRKQLETHGFYVRHVKVDYTLPKDSYLNNC